MTREEAVTLLAWLIAVELAEEYGEGDLTACADQLMATMLNDRGLPRCPCPEVPCS